MPLANLLTVFFIAIAGLLAYRFRVRILAPLKRFEARNQARRAEEIRAMLDGTAHYRQTLQLAEEQVEDVTRIEVPDERTGQPVARYLFLGVQYATMAEAEATRRTEIIGKARDFYMDLDRAWLPRQWWREPMATALPDLRGKIDVKPPRP